MIYATPNLNGNTRDDFLRAAGEVSDAARLLHNALCEVFHGRNYPTPGREDDVRRLTTLVQQIDNLASDIRSAAGDG